jgi:hypothetical protein
MKRKRRQSTDEDKKPPTLKAQQQKARKLLQMAAELESGASFSITRLATIKSLCQDAQTATRFTLHLAQLAQQRRDLGGDRQFYPAAEIKQHRQLAAESFALIEEYLARRSESRAGRLRELLWQAREVNNEYRNIPFGAVRSIKSWRVLLVEKALYCALAADETAAGYWAYQAARAYAEKYDPHYGTGLIPASAPLLAEIAGFWQAQYFDETGR